MAFADGDSLEIRVNCRADAGAPEAPVPYALVCPRNDVGDSRGDRRRHLQRNPRARTVGACAGCAEHEAAKPIPAIVGVLERSVPASRHDIVRLMNTLSGVTVFLS